MAVHAATTGRGSRRSPRASAAGRSRRRRSPRVEVGGARIQSTSAPAQKLVPPRGARPRARVPTSTNASESSAISAASNAFRVSGRASVTRRTSPSRSIRSAPTRDSLWCPEWRQKRFTVQLERVEKTGTMFRVPFDLGEAFGRARPPVKVTIRGHTWRTTPGVYDGVGHIVVNRDVKAATGVDAPERVRVEMELDTEPRHGRVYPPTCVRRWAPTTHADRVREALVHATGGSTSSGSTRPSGPRRARDASPPRSSASARAARRADGPAHGRDRGGLDAAARRRIAARRGRVRAVSRLPRRRRARRRAAFGTNGEAVLLSPDERRRGLELWLEAVAGRVLWPRTAERRRRRTPLRSPPMRPRRARTPWP